MNAPARGMAIGGVLGLFEGVAARAYAAVRAMMAAIVTGSVIKGTMPGCVTQRYGSSGPSSTGTSPALPLALMLLMAGSQASAGQPSAPPTNLTSLEFFLGRWEGTAEGKPGKGTVSREYTALLQSKILQATHRGVYPPQPANPTRSASGRPSAPSARAR